MQGSSCNGARPHFSPITFDHTRVGQKTGRMTASALVQAGARGCGERPLSADSVEKQRVAGAESGALNGARVPFLSGFSRLLRCGKELRQFAEVLGGGGKEEFVVRTAWAA